MDIPQGRRLYFFLQRGRDRTELDVPKGKVQSEPMSRLQAHLGIQCILPPSLAPLLILQSRRFQLPSGIQTGCSLNHLKCKAGITVGHLRTRKCCCFYSAFKNLCVHLFKLSGSRLFYFTFDYFMKLAVHRSLKTHMWTSMWMIQAVAFLVVPYTTMLWTDS